MPLKFPLRSSTPSLRLWSPLLAVLLLLVASFQILLVFHSETPQPSGALHRMNPLAFVEFSGSRVHEISKGVVSYENVCIKEELYTIVQGGLERKRIKVALHSYNDDQKPLRSPSFDYYHRGPGNYANTLKTTGNPAANWYNDSRKSLVEEDTLYTLQLHGNIGHCLSDMVFSLALDRFSRQQARARRPTFGKYVYARFFKVERSYQPDWCFEFLKAAGFLQPHEGIVSNLSKDGTVCFRKLYVPNFGLHRFPLSFDDSASIDALRGFSILEHFMTHNFTDRSLVYPTEALDELRKSVCQGLRLPFAPWKEEDLLKEEVSILLYNRKGSPRRHWKNDEEVAHLLEKEYHVKVEIVGEEWETMSFAEQISLYNSHSHILTVHGAHEGNLIACRPSTRIVEVQCVHPADPQPDESLSARHESTDSVAWYGSTSWFTSFSRRLGIEHFVIGESKGCAGGRDGIHGSTEIRVNATRLVHFFARRCGLTPRLPSLPL
jgi:hypothetical protein